MSLNDEHTPRSGSFTAKEQIEGRKFTLGFHWIPINEVKALELYTPQCRELLTDLNQGVQHFVYKEE